jgi:hypothetical protein
VGGIFLGQAGCVAPFTHRRANVGERRNWRAAELDVPIRLAIAVTT